MSTAVLEAREDGINRALARKGARFGVHCTNTFKNNGVYREGYSLDTARSISPVFYPPEEWLQKATDEEVADRLMDIDADAVAGTQNIDILDVLGADYILANVRPRLYGACNRHDMKELGRIYTEYLDLLVGYYVEIPEISGDEGIASVSITNQLLNQAGISIEELHSASLVNVGNEYSIRNLSEMIHEFFGLDEIDEDLEAPELMIITNPKGVYGAACILSDMVQEELREILGDEYIILPSSIHEVLAIPVALTDDISELLNMVKSINADVVNQIDRLTDSIYLYKEGRIRKVA